MGGKRNRMSAQAIHFEQSNKNEYFPHTQAHVKIAKKEYIINKINQHWQLISAFGFNQMHSY